VREEGVASRLEVVGGARLRVGESAGARRELECRMRCLTFWPKLDSRTLSGADRFIAAMARCPDACPNKAT
jgi:hypothetical protein